MISQFAAHVAAAFGGRLVCLGDELYDGDVILVEDFQVPDLPDLLDAMEQATAAIVVGTTTPEDLERRSSAAGLQVLFAGWSRRSNGPATTPLAILDRLGTLPPTTPAPADFRVVAIVHVFNEADVLGGTIAALVGDGVDVYVLDNWSTDGSYELASNAPGVIGIERFPADGPSAVYDAESLHGRVEELGTELEASWFVHLDADERRRAPWQDVSLRSGLAYVDRAGFNCIDHTVLEFLPVDEQFRPAHDIEDYFRHFRFAQRPGSFVQIKAWKNVGQPVQRAETFGHDTRFPGRRPFPYKFLNKHYPFRSSEHGQRKVFTERLPRYAPEAVARGFHVHYQQLKREHRFVLPEHELRRFDEAAFNRAFLVERLSGIGIQPGAAPPRMLGHEDEWIGGGISYDARRAGADNVRDRRA